MPTRTRQFYVPPGDRTLGAVNTFLRDLRVSQIQGVNVVQRGRGTDLHVLYEGNIFPEVTASSPTDGAWVRTDQYPTDMTLIFNVSIDKSKITDDTFLWVLEASTETVTAASVTFTEDDRRVDVPLPSSALGGYDGPLTLITEGIVSQDGVSPPDRIQISLNITDGLLPRGGELAKELTPKTGVLRMERFISRGPHIGGLVDAFVDGNSLYDQQVVETKHLRRTTSLTEAYLLWFETTYPRVLAITPTPNSTVAKEYGTEHITVAFSEPVSEYHLSGQDGVDRVFFDDTAYSSLPGGTLTQRDDDGTIWTISGTDLLNTEGVHTLLFKDVRSRFGEAHGIIQLYTWTVAPVNVAGGVGSSACVRDSFTGDDVTDTFNLTYDPVADCTVDVHRNGVWLCPDDWTILTSPARIQFTVAPWTDADIWVTYDRST